MACIKGTKCRGCGRPYKSCQLKNGLCITCQQVAPPPGQSTTPAEALTGNATIQVPDGPLTSATVTMTQEMLDNSSFTNTPNDAYYS